MMNFAHEFYQNKTRLEFILGVNEIFMFGARFGPDETTRFHFWKPQCAFCDVVIRTNQFVMTTKHRCYWGQTDVFSKTAVRSPHHLSKSKQFSWGNEFLLSGRVSLWAPQKISVLKIA
jgi:hypothetical protein